MQQIEFKYCLSLYLDQGTSNQSHLPSVHSVEELRFLVTLSSKTRLALAAPGQKGQVVLLGGHLVNRLLFWADGSNTDFTFWEEGYPPINSRRCLAVFSNMFWRDTNCEKNEGEEAGHVSSFIICQMKMSSSGKIYLYYFDNKIFGLCTDSL